MNAIAYLRVSTQSQGQSGLGLEAQQTSIGAWVTSNQAQLLATYTEVESGKRSDRPQLIKALAHARRSKATLVVAKLDRLARNVAFLSKLIEGDVPFIACDNPHANRLTLHILASVAEAEAEMISARTKAALQAYKARGGVLGGLRPECAGNLNEAAREKGRAAGRLANRRLASESYRDLLPLILELRHQGRTLWQIAHELTRQGHTTRRGRPWNSVQVMRVLRMEVTA